MKNLIVLFISILLFYSCSNQPEQNANNDSVNTSLNDTIIVKTNITDEIAGSAYRKRATEYYSIIKKDTSSTTHIFYESKADAKVSIIQQVSSNLDYYSDRLSELKLVLTEASQDYNLDSLQSLSMGRFVTTGDLAIAITEAYFTTFGHNTTATTFDYNKISSFLLQSQLVKDLNKIVKPYSKVVKRVHIEKVYFADKETLYTYSLISKDSANVPAKILDFSTWIEFEDL